MEKLISLILSSTGNKESATYFWVLPVKLKSYLKLPSMVDYWHLYSRYYYGDILGSLHLRLHRIMDAKGKGNECRDSMYW